MQSLDTDSSALGRDTETYAVSLFLWQQGLLGSACLGSETSTALLKPPAVLSDIQQTCNLLIYHLPFGDGE